MGLLMCCVVEQHEGGVNPTESMTRALISDDSIARQSTLGPVQLGYVSLTTSTHPIILKHSLSWQLYVSVFTCVMRIKYAYNLSIFCPNKQWFLLVTRFTFSFQNLPLLLSFDANIYLCDQVHFYVQCPHSNLRCYDSGNTLYSSNFQLFLLQSRD